MTLICLMVNAELAPTLTRTVQSAPARNYLLVRQASSLSPMFAPRATFYTRVVDCVTYQARSVVKMTIS